MNPLTQTVLSLSIGGTMMALMLYGMRWIFANRLPSAFYYYAWMLVLLRFALPLPGLLALPDRSGTRAAEPTELTAGMPAEAGGTQGEINAEINALREPRFRTETGYSPAAGPEMQGESAGGAGSVNAAVDAEVPEERAGDSAETLRHLLRQGAESGILLTLLWAAGAALCFTRYLISYSRFARALHRTLRDARESDLAVLAALGGGRRPALKRNAAAATPMLVGVLRPKIILPDRDYDDKTLENILRHELTHYRRRDLICKWFAVGIYALHWFNPVTRLLRRELDRDCELSCDERLLRHMGRLDKQSYGETLLSLAAEKDLPRRVVATTFATEKRNLKERLVQIMTYKNKGRATLALVLAMLLLLCGCGAAAGPAANQGEQPPAEVQAAPPTPENVQAPMPTPENAGQKAEPVTYANNVTVKTVDELLAAIAPDTCITMEMGVYNLATAENYGADGGEYYKWEDAFDGYELVISGVDKLRIQGTDADEVILSAKPRYADVLSFRSCANIAVGDLTAGHTEEPGQCAGGVLDFQSTDGVLVDDCALYGCGILGVAARDCANIRVEDTDIYDCSDGAAWLQSCNNAVFDDCEIYKCKGNSLILIRASNEVAIINSELHDNSVGFALFASEYSQDVYLGGIEAKNNRFEYDNTGVLSAKRYPITVDGCELGGESVAKWFPEPQWSTDDENVGAVSLDGTPLTGDDLAKMKLKDDVVWQAKERPDVSAEALDLKPGEDGMIHVKTVDEFLAAIAPNTTIYLEPGEYDLSAATNYGTFGGRYYSWAADYDGSQLVIANAENLTIRAESAEKTSIVTAPRYADVLHFTYCDGLTLENFTAGHIDGPGSCVGDVLGFDDCDEVKIDGCSLYGCGVKGVSAYGCEDMKITATEIHGCSYGAADFSMCENVSMDNCNVHDNGENTYSVYDCKNVTLDGKELRDGVTKK